MTINRRTFGSQIAAAALLSSGAFALVDASPASAQANESAAVADAVSALTKAMLEADRAKLNALTADQLSYGHSAGKLEDKPTFVGVIADKKTHYKSIVLSDQTVSVVGSNAIVRHNWQSESGTGDGKWNVSKIGVLQVW